MTPETPERKPRRRPQPTWVIHSAAGARAAGGEGPAWWDDARPADPETAPPIYSGDCSEAPR